MRVALILLSLGACRHGAHDDLEDLPPPPLEAARCCLTPKQWEATDAGWVSPRWKDATLEPGKYAKTKMSLTRGLTYRFEACGSPGTVDLDLLLYDSKGNVILKDDTTDREPVITWTAPDSGSRTLVVYLRETEDGRPATAAWYWASYDPD